MKFLVLFALLSLLVLVNSSPDSKSEDGKTSDEPKIVQFNIQCLEQPDNTDDDQVGSAAEESPLLSKLQLPNLKDKLNLNKNPKLRSIVQPKEDGEVKTESDQTSASSKLKEKLENLKKDGSDLRNLLLSKTQDMVGSSSADQPEVKSSLLPQLRERLDNLKEKINNDSKLPNTETTLGKLKEKLGKLKDKTERSDVVGAAQNNPSPSALPAPNKTLNKLKEKLNELKNKSQKPLDTVGAAQNEPSPSILLPPSSAKDRINEKINELKNKAPSIEELKSKMNSLKEKVQNRELVGAAQSDSLSLALPTKDQMREKINELKNKAPSIEDLKNKMNNLKEKVQNRELVGAAQSDSLSLALPTRDQMREKINELKNKSPSLEELKGKMNDLKEKVKYKELVGAAQSDSLSLTLPSTKSQVREKINELKGKLQKPGDIVGSNLKEKINDLKEKLKNPKDIVGAAQENSPSVASPPDEAMDRKEEIENNQSKSSPLDNLKEKVNNLKEKFRNMELVGAAQGDAPSIALPEATKQKLEELKEKFKNPSDIVKSTQDNFNQKISDLKEKAKNKDNTAVDKMREKLNKLKEKSKNLDMVGAAQNIPPLKKINTPNMEQLKEKLNQLKQRTANNGESATLNKLKERLNNLKEKNQDIVSAAQNIQPLKTLPSPSETLTKLREKINNLRENSNLQDMVRAAQTNLLPKKLQPPTSPLSKLKDQLADLKQRSNNLQSKDLPEPSKVINKLRNQMNDLRQKTRRSDLVGASQNEAPAINLPDPFNILNGGRRNPNILGRQSITRPQNQPPNRIEDRVREISRLIPPIQLPTFEARLIPAPIRLGDFEPVVRSDRVIETVAPAPAQEPRPRDTDGSASQVENIVAVSPFEEKTDELLLEPDEDQTANDSMMEPVTTPSKLSETKNKLNKLAETIKSRTAELIKPTVKPSLSKITSAIDNMKKKLGERKSDLVGSPSRALGRAAKKGQSEVSYAGITQSEVEKKSCDICSCLMKYLGKNEQSRAVTEKPKPKFPFSLKKPNLFRLGDQNVLEDRVQPSFLRPPKNFRTKNIDLVGNGIPNSLIPGDNEEENIKKLVEFANMVEELDDFLSRKTKTVISRLSKFIDAGKDNE